MVCSPFLYLLAPRLGLVNGVRQFLALGGNLVGGGVGLDEGIVFIPHSVAGGAEFRFIPMLPLRAGMATSFEHFAITGGVGFHAAFVHVDFAAGRWGLGGGDGFVSALSVSFWPAF